MNYIFQWRWWRPSFTCTKFGYYLLPGGLYLHCIYFVKHLALHHLRFFFCFLLGQNVMHFPHIPIAYWYQIIMHIYLLSQYWWLGFRPPLQFQKLSYGQVAHHVSSFAPRNKPIKQSTVVIFMAASRKPLSPRPSFGRCARGQRSEVTRRAARWEPGTRARSRWFAQFDWSHEAKVARERCLLMRTVWTTDLVSVHSGATGRSERTTQQMTPCWERCCGDRKHQRPRPCLHRRSQCDACGETARGWAVAYVPVHCVVTSLKAPRCAGFTLTVFFYLYLVSSLTACEAEVLPQCCFRERRRLHQVSLSSSSREAFVPRLCQPH